MNEPLPSNPMIDAASQEKAARLMDAMNSLRGTRPVSPYERRALLEYIAELEHRGAPETTWQPIETAPPGRVLLWIVARPESEWPKTNDNRTVGISPDFRPHARTGKRGDQGPFYMATHWQPLPSAPTTGGE